MATIGQYLSLITNAVYGEEVRSAIVNAIQQCYTDATDVVKVSETEPTSENTRIWIKPTTDECKVPTWEEHEELSGEVSDLKSAIDADYSSQNDGKLLFPAVFERGNVTNTGTESDLTYRVRSKDKITFPENVEYTIAEGFKAKKLTWIAATDELVSSATWYTGSTIFKTGYKYKLLIARVTEDQSEVADVATFAKAVYRESTDSTLTKQNMPANAKTVGDEFGKMNMSISFHPYGIEPFQMSIFKPTSNLYSDFCYHITDSYYRYQQNPDTNHYPRISGALNWQGWLIRVKPGTTYAVGPLDFKVEFLKNDWSLDTQITEVSDSQPNILTTGNESCWMCLTQRKDRDMSGWMMVEGDTYPSEYVSGEPQLVQAFRSGVGKTIAFFGDSITAGSGWTGEPSSQGYHQYIHDMYGYTCLNYGYGGSGYVRDYQKKSDTPGYEEEGAGVVGVHGQGKPGRGYGNRHYHFWPNHVSSIMSRISDETSLDDLEKVESPTSLDGIVIFAGTNDWSNGVSLENFANGVESTFNYYHSNFGSVPLLVMTPIHRLSDTTSGVANLSQYVDIIIQKCREHGIPYIDTFTMSGAQPNNETNRSIFFVRDDDGSNDGVHPNHLAHQRIARAIGETLNQLVLCKESVAR